MGRQARFCLLGVGLGIGIIVLLKNLGLAQAPKIPANARAAVVNGEEISLAEVDEIIKQRPTPLNAPTASQVRQMRLEVVTALVDDMLVRQFMREHAPKVDATQIDRQLATLSASLKEKGKTFTEYLKETNQTEAQLRSGMLLLLQLDQYVKNNTTDADLKKYWESNRDYFDKTTIRTSHIVIRLSATSPPTEREKAKQKLQGVRADIAAGKLDFAAAAREHSQCPSAPKGGDIGFIFRKFQNVDESYARTAFAMKVGDVSEIVETEFGVHLIKVTERKEGTASKFEQCLEDVRDSYAEDLRLALLNQLRKKARVEVTLP